jgi:hypothetical protein
MRSYYNADPVFPCPLFCSAANMPIADPRQSLSTVGNSVITLGKVRDTELKQDIPIFKVQGKNGFFFTSKMAVDADGAYNAYHPNNICGLDYLKNAYNSGKWYGVVTDDSGNPVTQTASSPAPGYYISPTSLEDCSKSPYDPTRYTNSQRIPYFVLPTLGNANNFFGAKPGDFGVVLNKKNGKMSCAIFADIYPIEYSNPPRIGEGSMALADALGINNNPKAGGIYEKTILYIVFPGTGAGRCTLRTIEEIVENAKLNFQVWGGMEQVKALQMYI